MASSSNKSYSKLQLFGLIFGILTLLLPAWVSPPTGLSLTGWRLIGVASMMATWWVCGPVHITITALIPLIALPLLNITDIKAAAAPFASPVVFLLLGGFLIACALQKWKLHRRLALIITVNSGHKVDHVILGFMIAVAFLSMWISNTASTLLMITIAKSIIETIGQQYHIRDEDNFIGTAMMLGIAYAASIGGMSTLVGTAPNAFLAGFLSSPPYHIQISFVNWMALALPIVIIMIPLCWFMLTHIIFRDCVDSRFTISEQTQSIIRNELAAMGTIKSPEWRVGLVFSLIAAGWILRPTLQHIIQLPGLNDASISIIGGVLLFLIPSGATSPTSSTRLLEWQDTTILPWNVILLFGGGLSLATAISSTDVASWLGTHLTSLDHVHSTWQIAIFATITSLATEITSNTATTTTFIPIISAFAERIGLNPVLLTAPVTMTASCAFMLPVATPPNALVFSTPYVTIPRMIKAGFLINICAVITICITCVWLVPLLF